MAKMNEEEVKKVLEKHPHLKRYIEGIKNRMGEPVFYSSLPFEVRDEEHPNLIYPTKGSVFVHIYKTADMDERMYHAIEPHLNEEEKKKHDQLLDIIVRKAPEKKSVRSNEELKKVLKELIDEIIEVDENAEGFKPRKKGLFGKPKDKIKATSSQKNAIEYYVMKNVVGNGQIECFMRDPWLEDIHVVTGEKIHLIHKIFGMTKTNVELSKENADEFVRQLSEKMGSPVSEGNPIADGVLPDGSRGNIVYSDSISIRGPSMTIRRFTETPISVTQLIKWGTMNTGIAAYLWICLEYGRNFFICGGTACGKTTTMNAIVPFIPPEKKIYSAEQSPELQVPHKVWQRLLTKDSGPKEGQVDMFDLLKAALRSRPEYIIPGEVRGAEGNIVFGAMQTGHPCMTTFHAGSVTQVIQRFTSHPINVPKTFMDNLDFVVIQLAIERDGKLLRRVTTIDEIEGYNRAVDGIMSRRAFEWNALDDKHRFVANRNSYVLEERIAKTAGYEDLSEIYSEYERRKHILERMVEEDIMDYYEVTQSIWGFYKEGEKGIPIKV
ncbi:MAG: type II/IV secretion system ATPase subunit [Candidatus Thermoplasmatota archaeon]